MSPIQKLLEQLNSALAPQEDHALKLHELKIEFLQRRREILRQLESCQKSGGVVGVYSDTLGKGMFLVTVLQIVKERTLVLRSIYSNGQLGGKVLLDIDEVVSLCPFNQVYIEPAPEQEHADMRSQLTMFPRVN